MDVREFEDLIDRLGEDFSLWPDVQRLAAVDLLATSATAQAVLEEARALRSALATPIVSAPAGLADRIVLAASRLKQNDLPIAQQDDEGRARRVTQPS